MSSSFVTPNYLMQYPQTPSVNDYRCVVNAAGTQVIFERTLHTASAAAKNDADLYLLDLPPGNQPSKFLTAPNMPLPAHSDRPDWSWQSGDLVIFNWIGQDGSLQVGLASKDGSTVQPLKHTHNMSYPTWFPDWTLAVMDHDKAASPNPSTSKIDMDGKMLQRALAGSTLLAGMPSVNQKFPNLIAFAGQLVETPPVKYDQDSNYIWVVDLSTGTATPLEGSGLSKGPFQPDLPGPRTLVVARRKLAGLRILPCLSAGERQQGDVCDIPVRLQHSQRDRRAIDRSDVQHEPRQVVSERLQRRSGRPDPGRGGLSDGSRCGGAAVWHRQP